MRRRESSIRRNIDWVTIALVAVLMFFGWINILSATSNIELLDWLNWTGKGGKQLMWISICFVLGFFIINIESEFFIRTSVIQYILTLLLLIAVLIIGKKIGGARSWFDLGGFSLQPSEFAKPTTALILAWYLSRDATKWRSIKVRLISLLLIATPAGLILLQPDAGTVLVFAGFIFVLYREGLSGNVLIIGFAGLLLSIATILIGVTSFHYPYFGVGSGMGLFWIIWLIVGALVIYLLKELSIPRRRKKVAVWGIISLFAGLIMSIGLHTGMEKMLQPHQKERIHVLFGIDVNNPDADYNIRHAKAAIGSGGLTGKGWMHGPMTAYSFVPEQETDFIFCTVGEEWGFLGSAFVIFLFTFLLLRILIIAERQRSKFTRIYAYGVASILFMHLLVNVGMVLGLAPVIGIPLPFFSYGGSSLLGFTFLISVLIRLDGERLNVLR
jgi:rod shape determining protein RodA